MRRAAPVAVLAALLSLARVAHAEIKLPALVSDGMVLQQKTPVRVWGWADDGESIRVSFRGQTATTVAKDGKWSVFLRPLEPAPPASMTISSGTSALEIKDVVVGEVWLCSGQSNMEFGLAGARDAKTEIESPSDPLLRTFTVARQVADAPKADVAGGRWEAAAPDTRADFSAVAYYFGRALRRARNVPVGLIHSSWGGTPAEAWTSRSALTKWGMPESSFRQAAVADPAATQEYERRLAAWKAAGSPQGRFIDPGPTDHARSWALPQMDSRDWPTMSVPQPWERVGPNMEIDGAVWFRKGVEVPARWAGKDLELHLGAIDDLDTTFVDGRPVGKTTEDVPLFWEARRRYKVPASAASVGHALIAVRVWDQTGAGGFMGPADDMWLAPPGAPKEERISLAGGWRYRVETERRGKPDGPPGDPQAPAALYNGMIAPLLPYTIKGAAWYQGESNTGRASQYRSLLGAMIRGWRGDWGVGDFPFLIVELAPFMPISSEPQESQWAELREAQSQVTHDLPNVATIVITDAGDEKDIHPTNKEPVGERLALAARKVAYHEALTAFGPTFRSLTIAGDKAIVAFDDVDAGLDARGETLAGFAVAGKDKKFVFAHAAIAGRTVVVSSPDVPSPAYVRFGWANFPVVNLWNKAGLPANPFRTDAR